MNRAFCHRCNHRNRRGGRYCATCGCPLHAAPAESCRAEHSSNGAVLSWVVFGLALVGAIRWDSEDRRGANPSTNRRPAIGLIIDLPPEYPASYFQTER